MRQKITVMAQVDCVIDIMANPSNIDISEQLEKKLNTLPYIHGAAHVKAYDCFMDGRRMHNIGEIRLSVEYEPFYILFGDEACDILFKDNLSTLITAIEEDGIDYELYMFEGDLPELLTYAEKHKYAFLTEIEYKQLKEIE